MLQIYNSIKKLDLSCVCINFLRYNRNAFTVFVMFGDEEFVAFETICYT
jgi:hypothetical protein